MQMKKILSSNLLNQSLKGRKLVKTTIRSFSGSIDEIDIPTIDLDKFLHKKQNWERECKLAAECLHDTGIMIVKDPVKHISCFLFNCFEIDIKQFYCFLLIKFFKVFLF